MKRIIITVILIFLATPVYGAEGQREQIGEAMGNPVYRDQLDERRDLYSQVHKLFRDPFQKRCMKAHKDEIEVEDWEIEYVTRYFQERHSERLKNKDSEANQRFDPPPGRDLVKFLLSSWKFNIFLYNRYGKGRVIWEQEGLVPFDAMLTWLKSHEKRGDFKITDPKLHEAFYSYWKENENSRFFLDELRVQSEFLHPAWEPVMGK